MTKSTGTTTASGPSVPRKLIIVRHGERIDFTFNRTEENWVASCFDENGHFQRNNINMPRSLPARKDGYANYAVDTPLTEIGYLQAKITGRALKDAGVKISHVYCSPAYRCVQTCTGILKGMSCPLSFNIEPCLFEWGAWFKPRMPSWIKPEEFAAYGLPANSNHKPLMASTHVRADESLEDYYNRSHHITRKILDQHPEDGNVILLVAHGASIDTCSRQLCGKLPRPSHDFYNILHSTPYLATAMCVEDSAAGSWKVVQPPVLPFQHSGNLSYDWKVLEVEDTVPLADASIKSKTGRGH